MTVVKKGNTSPRLAEGSEFILSNDGDSAVAVFTGDYNALKSDIPEKGALVTYEDVQYIAQEVRLRRVRGALGFLTIMLSSAEGAETVEIDWSIIEKPLESHPMFDDIFRNPDDFTNLFILKKWEAEEDPYIKARFLYLENGGVAGTGPYLELPPIVKKYARKIAAGIDSYMLQVPVVRRTLTVAEMPTSSAAGQREDPPGYVAARPAWLKTKDSARRSGKRGAWERIEEWTGFDSLDEDLYPASAPPAEE